MANHPGNQPPPEGPEPAEPGPSGPEPAGPPRDAGADGRADDRRGNADDGRGGADDGDGEAAELAELRGRLAVLEQRKRGARFRLLSLLSAVLVVLAALLAPVSVVATWAHSQITDTDRYVATVGPLALDPAVRGAVTDQVTAQIVAALPIDSLLSLVPGADQPLIRQLLGAAGGALNNAVTSVVRDQVAAVVDSDAFAGLWVEINRTAHDSLNRALTGQGGGAVQIKGNTVTLDLAPVIDQVKNRLAARGLGVASQIPVIHTDYVLVESDAIPKVRSLLRLLQVVGNWVPVAAVLLAVGGVLAAARRRRAAVTVALAMAGATAALGIGLTVFRSIYLDQLPADVNQAAAGAVYDALAHYLYTSVRVVVVLGVLVALGAWVSGSGRWARAVRILWRAGIDAVRRAAERLGMRLGPVGRFVHRAKLWLNWAAVLAAFGLLVTWHYPTDLVVVWLTVALLAVLAVVEFLDEPGGFRETAEQQEVDEAGGTA
ncbi:hypothetical protein LN042_10905 [Kitasatospora sp. RB6PN24]|uniref:hypothetical protein n=1 Tax=Kitasatospora humi TaxID=2893891 RepID=UPI001E3B8900|nr:hypothetical protein [Kitasatospora humi]MCC9307605.1 hypothetical protein [Kitasatospora humi]